VAVLLLLAVAVVTGATLARGITDDEHDSGDPLGVGGTVSETLRPRTADDDLRGAALATIQASGGDFLEASKRSRKVFETPGGEVVYVVPGVEAGTYSVVLGAAVRRYHDPLSASRPVTVAWRQAAAGEPFEAFGLAVDEVVSVDVVLHGKTYPAMLADNGWWWIAPDGKTTPMDASIVVRLEDGSEVDL
jgi:hypothetical protein